ncbi:MAG TPA: DNA-binding protein, partial [Gammaproteobacteria bacterium]|nr:DNA-binding protein [Gammaproteobacteria bacterium]
MARPGVGYFEVVEAANHLLGQGKNPTIEQIRHLLGTGSSTTLANHLRQWKNDHSQSQKLSIQENLPKEFLSLMQGLWKRLREEALEKVAQEELVFQARVD